MVLKAALFSHLDRRLATFTGAALLWLAPSMSLSYLLYAQIKFALLSGLDLIRQQSDHRFPSQYMRTTLLEASRNSSQIEIMSLAA